MLGSKRFSGIDLHDHYISCATVKLERNFPVLQNLVKRNMPNDLIEAGRLIDRDMLKMELNGLVKNDLISRNVHLTIPTQNILIRKVTTFPDVGEAELKKLLQFHIGETIHLPFQDPIYDFVKLGSIIPNTNLVDEWSGNGSEEEEEELPLGGLAEEAKSEVLLFATSNGLSREIADLCITSSLKPLSAEIRGLALQRLLLYVHPHWLRETEIIIDASESSVDIHIFKGNVIVFSRRMSIQLNDLNTVEENEAKGDVFILEDSGFDPLEEHREAAATKEQPGHRGEDAYINEIILEVERAQNFFRYSLHKREDEIKRAIVTGENASKVFAPLRDRMEYTKVVRIDYNSILDPGFTEHELLDSCSAAIGLALRANEKPKKK